MSNAEIHDTDGGGHVHPSVKRLADQLSQTHDCRVVIARERSGYHIYLPCPDCLETHGRKELRDPKYSINASKYFAIGDDFNHLQESTPGDFNPGADAHNLAAAEVRDTHSGVCMRTRSSGNPHRHSVSSLLRMSSIPERHPDIMTRADVVSGAGSAERESYWEPDPITGVLCPPSPGKVTPLVDLPSDHPGRWYLETYRKFDIARLYEQFRVSWCYEEQPESREKGIFYRRMPNGWKDTPQGRVIFYALHNGTPLTWQARYPECESNDRLNKFALHPYTGNWDLIATRANEKATWIPVSPFDSVDEEGNLRFNPSKYRTAKYSSRELMGWDAAIKRANDSDETYRWCILTEGPLDAGRLGPGAMPLIGSSINIDNAAKVTSNFHIVFTGFDRDVAGREATEKVTAQLHSSRTRNPILALVVPLPIPEGKDFGEMAQAEADQILADALRRAKRML